MRGCRFFSKFEFEEELLEKRVITFAQYNEATKVQAEAEAKVKKAEAEIKKAEAEIKKAKAESKKLQAEILKLCKQAPIEEIFCEIKAKFDEVSSVKK